MAWEGDPVEGGEEVWEELGEGLRVEWGVFRDGLDDGKGSVMSRRDRWIGM